MKQIEINGKDFNIPTSWEDIKLKDYVKIIEIVGDGEEKTDNQKTIEILSALLGEEPIFFYKTKLTVFNEIVGFLDFLVNPYSTEEEYVNETVHVGDVIYFIDKDCIKNMTMGEQISYQEYVQRTKKRTIDCIAPALGLILYENEPKEEFDAKKYIEKINYIYENIKYIDAFKISTFFFLN